MGLQATSHEGTTSIRSYSSSSRLDPAVLVRLLMSSNRHTESLLSRALSMTHPSSSPGASGPRSPCLLAHRPGVSRSNAAPTPAEKSSHSPGNRFRGPGEAPALPTTIQISHIYCLFVCLTFPSSPMASRKRRATNCGCLTTYAAQHRRTQGETRQTRSHTSW